MNLYKLIWLELSHRKSQLISALIAITLGIGVIVGIKTITVFSEKAVAVKLDNLGANILVLPQGAGIDDYYTADIDAPTIPEEYVEKILSSTLSGVDNLSPKLTRRVLINNYKIVLTGILPASEIASKPLWQNVGLFGNELEASCATSNDANKSHGYEDEKLQRKVVDTLNNNDCLIGSLAAKKLNIIEGGKIEILGNTLNVKKILPQTGTIDDDRIFANLKLVQSVLNIDNQISAIEIMGCCNAISEGLLSELRNILPNTRITTIGQIVSTQIETNQMMDKLSLIFLIIILFVGGISIGNYMWANVNERRKEIGTLRMIGATKKYIYQLLLIKAAILGIIGGTLGYVLGTISGIYLGPEFAQIDVQAVYIYFLYSIIISMGISLIGSVIPAALAAKIEPFSNMQEV
jgi:putative ABC transport system permease protein